MATMTNPPPLQSMPDAWVTKWLSAARFAVYEGAAGGDRELALALYEWNTTASAAILHDLAHIEVGLRNVYNTALETYAAFGSHWTSCGSQVFAPEYRTKKHWDPVQRKQIKFRVDVNTKPRRNLEAAIEEAGGAQAAPGKVIAQLMFGFWRYLSSSAHDVSLWRPYLHHAFPPGTARVDVDVRVGQLHGLRNRVAHHEPLLAENLSSRHNALIELANLIDPQLAVHIGNTTTVPTLVAGRPC